jgi:hypothetical protein
MTITSLNIPTAIIEHAEEQAKSGLFLDAQDYLLHVLRKDFETHQRNKLITTPSQNPVGTTLMTIRDVVPGKDRRLEKTAKDGNVLKLVGDLNEHSYLAVSVKLRNYDRKYKSTAWFFARGLGGNESPEDFPQRDQREDWLNSWWCPLVSNGAEGSDCIYVFDLLAAISSIRSKYKDYSHIEFEGISTLRFSDNLRLSYLVIHRHEKE